MQLTDWMGYEIFGSPLLTWIGGLALFVVVWLALGVARHLICRRLDALATRHRSESLAIAAHASARTRGWFLLLAALFIGSRVWDLPARFDARAIDVAVIAFLVQTGFWLSAAARKGLDLKRERELDVNPGGAVAMDVLSFVSLLGIWSVLLLVMLDNLGVNVTALVAGLGVGGVAVALAAQNILGDLFASLSIVLDKPFVLGDFIMIDQMRGTVEKVGIKTTRIRSLSGEQLVFSNNDLLGSRLQNYGRMQERRVDFTIGVTYDTGSEALRRIPALLEEAVSAQPGARFDRAHFSAFGDFALLFETVYFVGTPDYTTYMDVQQAINLRIYELLDEAGIRFAFPTQTIHIDQAATALTPAAVSRASTG